MTGIGRVSCRSSELAWGAWRDLRQEEEPNFVGGYFCVILTYDSATDMRVGHIGGQGVGDIIFRDARDAHAGPFKDIKAFHDYFARFSCRRHPEWNPRSDFEELEGFTDDRAVVFTHADLDKSNVLISPAEEGSPPHVIAVLDWHQSGWYPADWEWLKAQWCCEPHPAGGRDSAWVNKVVAPADDAYFYGWGYIVSSL